MCGIEIFGPPAGSVPGSQSANVRSATACMMAMKQIVQMMSGVSIMDPRCHSHVLEVGQAHAGCVAEKDEESVPGNHR